jgi:hypothetical protein
MSEQEQITIAGKLVNEYAAIRRELGAVTEKARICSGSLGVIARAPAPSSDSPRQSSFDLSSTAWQEAMLRYPEKEELLCLVEEINSATQRKRELFRSLKEMGFDPKERGLYCSFAGWFRVGPSVKVRK